MNVNTNCHLSANTEWGRQGWEGCVAPKGWTPKSDLKQNRVNKQQTEKRLKQKSNKTAKA